MYKRQQYGRLQILPLPGPGGAPLLDRTLEPGQSRIGRRSPVSYTHLDVYKRQDPDTVGARGRFRRKAAERGISADRIFADGDGLGPVSYTHRDVYKRQMHPV